MINFKQYLQEVIDQSKFSKTLQGQIKDLRKSFDKWQKVKTKDPYADTPRYVSPGRDMSRPPIENHIVMDLYNNVLNIGDKVKFPEKKLAPRYMKYSGQVGKIVKISSVTEFIEIRLLNGGKIKLGSSHIEKIK